MRFGLSENTIGQVNSVFARFPEIEQAILYGSRAKGSHQEGSDIDLALQGEQLTRAILQNISMALDDLPLLYSFDLSRHAEITNPDLLDHIRRVGTVFYQKPFVPNAELPAVRNGKIFLLGREKLINIRLDPTYYFDIPNTTGFVKLSKIAHVSGGKRLPLGADFSNEPTNYRYLRVGDIDWQGNLDYTNLKYLPDKTFSELKRYEIKNGELAIAIVGATIGKIALIEKPYSDHVILTENCAKICLKNSKVLEKYLFILLQSKTLQRQIQSNFIQTTLPKLGLDRLESLLLPPIPNLSSQHQIVQKIETAYTTKRTKEAEAARLLASIDGYLLEQLGITLPEAVERKKTFFVSSEKMSGGRLDPFYFANQNYKIEGGVYVNKPLKVIATLDKGQSITKDSISEGDYPVIAGGQTSPYTHQNYNQEGNVITVSASGAYSGYVWYHPNRIFASDCTVIRSKNENEVSTLFLSEILKLKQKEIYYMQQGAGQPHVYASDLSKLLMPIPPFNIQSVLIAHINEIRDQAQQLESSAKAEVEAAKKAVEAMILGAGDAIGAGL